MVKGIYCDFAQKFSVETNLWLADASIIHLMNGMIEFTCDGDRYEGYLATPASGKGKGVIVLQEWWGLVGHIKDVADRFAGEGLTALAPDLYRGKTTTEPDEAGSMLMALNISETSRTLACAIRRLLEDDATEGDKVGVVGFCMGGQLSLFAACENPESIGACVNFYGVHPNVHPDFARLGAPVLGLFGEDDHITPPAVVAQMDEALDALGKPHEFVTYPRVGHAFFNDDRHAVYDANASADAWRRVLSFLRTNL